MRLLTLNARQRINELAAAGDPAAIQVKTLYDDAIKKALALSPSDLEQIDEIIEVAVARVREFLAKQG
jgi:hypothetical protein